VIEERVATQYGQQVCHLLIGKALGHCRGWDVGGRNVSRLSGDWGGLGFRKLLLVVNNC
jgi:hypothetical protein